MYGFLSSNIVAHILAIYFAYKLLQCELVSIKYPFYTIIILHTFSLILTIFTMIIYAFYRDLYNEAYNYVKNTPTPKSLTTTSVKPSKITLSIVGILLLVYFIFSILLIFIDLYFLYKLFECNTLGFVIYIAVLLITIILQLLKL
jgi:hypothetical protein